MPGSDPPLRPTLSAFDAAAIIVGVVVGAGIFKTPAMVAASSPSAAWMIGAWVLGGACSLVGALCYAELATAHPHPGGDYHYLSRAWGRPVGFLFAWARLAVLQTGSIAMQAYLVGDYLAYLAGGGAELSALFAGLSVALLTGVNVAGLRPGAWTQNALSVATVLGLVAMSVLVLSGPRTPPVEAPAASSPGAFGVAMIFVLLTYGGWNEAAYVSAEVRDGRRNLVRALVWGIGAITLLYVVANLAYLRGLGLSDMARSEVVASDLMRRVTGDAGARVVGWFVAFAALSTMNATIITGARSSWALGNDHRLFGPLGRWRTGRSTPANALLAQAAVTMALIAFGMRARSGFVAMVEYTAPVFWLFFLLTAASLMRLRRHAPAAPRPYRVPLYPALPLLFCGICAYMLQASVRHTGTGATVGLVVLALGVPLYALSRRAESKAALAADGGKRWDALSRAR